MDVDTERRHPLDGLDEADREFIVRFVLASGSLKEVAQSYGVSYPTIRARLDRLIARLEDLAAGRPVDPLTEALAGYVERGEMRIEVARAIQELHRKVMDREDEGMWFPEIDPNMFGAYYGALVGGVGGTLCGLLGAAAGTLAHRGVGRRWVMGAMWLLELFGLSQLVFGIAALVYGQPYGIWYAPLLTGVVLSGLFAALIPVMRRVYAEAEQRKVDAEGLRRGL